MRPTRPGIAWLFVATAFAVTGLSKNINLILLVSYFLFGLAAWNYFGCRRTVRRMTLRRLATGPVFAGDLAPCEYELVNRGNYAVTDAVISDAPFGQAIDWPVPRLMAGEKANLTRLGLARRRGEFESKSAALTCSAPFGLFLAHAPSHLATTTWVYPCRGVIDIDRLRLRLPALGIGRERRRALVPIPAEGTDIHGLHPFRTGDSPRLIHWKTTARVGEPMVREFDRNSAPDLLATIDARWIGADSTGRRLEFALDFLATLVWTWSTKSDAKLTIAFPDFVHEVSQRADAHAVLRRLALAKWTDRAATWNFSYDSVSDRVPILVLGDASSAVKRGISVDPTVACEFYRPAEHNDE